MKLGIDPDKLTDSAGPVERGHDVWKREKVERGLEQAKDRASLIPAEQVLRDLGI